MKIKKSLVTSVSWGLLLFQCWSDSLGSSPSVFCWDCRCSAVCLCLVHFHFTWNLSFQMSCLMAQLSSFNTAFVLGSLFTSGWPPSFSRLDFSSCSKCWDIFSELFPRLFWWLPSYYILFSSSCSWTPDLSIGYLQLDLASHAPK